MASCKRNFLNVNHGKLGRLKVNLIICKLQCHLTNSFQLGSHSPSYFLQHKLCIVSTYFSKTFGCWVFTNGMTAQPDTSHTAQLNSTLVYFICTEPHFFGSAQEVFWTPRKICPLKFMFSKKATKIDEIFTVDLTLTT